MCVYGRIYVCFRDRVLIHVCVNYIRIFNIKRRVFISLLMQLLHIIYAH